MTESLQFTVYLYYFYFEKVTVQEPGESLHALHTRQKIDNNSTNSKSIVAEQICIGFKLEQ